MARFAISLVALFLVASYVSATTLQELCQGTYDANYCVKFLKPTVSKSTNFKSKVWHKIVINRAVIRAMIAHDLVVKKVHKLKPSDVKVLRTCIVTLNDSMKLIKKGDFDGAATNQEHCSDSLKDAGKIVQDVKDLANEATTATRVVRDIIAKV